MVSDEEAENSGAGKLCNLDELDPGRQLDTIPAHSGHIDFHQKMGEGSCCGERKNG